MSDPSGIEDDSDEDLEVFIEELRRMGHTNVASNFERKLKLRQSMPNWKELLADFRTKEGVIYREWCQKMLRKGLTHPYIETRLLKENLPEARLETKNNV